jgi:hypothetical protein
MKLDVKFKENEKRLAVDFGAVHKVSDGGYQKGYEAGKEDGYGNGYTNGYTVGTAEGKEQGKAEGYTQGKADGVTEGIEQGKQAEYDAFWDIYQDYGNRRHYSHAFAGLGWRDTSFKPKYDIFVSNAYMMFADSNIKDLKSALENCCVVLDTSQCINFQYMFMNSRVEKIGVIDTRGHNKLVSTFGAAYIVFIEKIVLRDDGSQTFSDFITTPALVDVVIEGVIGQNGFSVSICTKLSRASITSVINALSTTTTGLAVTFSLVAVNKAFETAEGANDGSTSAEWLALVATRSNWTIALA